MTTFFAYVVFERLPDKSDRFVISGTYEQAWFAYNNLNEWGYNVRMELHQWAFDPHTPYKPFGD